MIMNKFLKNHFLYLTLAFLFLFDFYQLNLYNIKNKKIIITKLGGIYGKDVWHL